MGTLAVFLTAYSAAVHLATSVYRCEPLSYLSEYFDSPELQEQEPGQLKVKAATKVDQPRGDMSTTTDTIPEQQLNLADLRPSHDPQPGAVLEVGSLLFHAHNLIFVSNRLLPLAHSRKLTSAVLGVPDTL